MLGLFTFKDYGISVDEEWHRISGFYWLNYILSFTSFDELKNIVGIQLNEFDIFYFGTAFEVVANNPYHGVVFDLPVAALEVILNLRDSQEIYLLKHLINFLVFFFIFNMLLFIKAMYWIIMKNRQM